MPDFTEDPIIEWASRLLLAETSEGARPALAIDPTMAREAFRFQQLGDRLTITGGSSNGLAYGITEIADRRRYARADVPRALVADETHSPATPVRGILRTFSSDVLDLPWFRSRAFWDSYLDELATSRFNRFQLALGMQYNYSHDPGVVDNYLCFPYPFLIDVPGCDVSVTGVSKHDREENLAALRTIGAECARRGISFQLGLWNHSLHCEPGPAPSVRYRIEGLPEAEIARYIAAALPVLLREVPTISGLTFRVHYEGGVREDNRTEFWSTALGGLALVERPITVDLHSKGVDHDLIEIATRSCSGRVQVSAKFWAEHEGLPYHQAAVRDMEQAQPARDDPLRGITQGTRRFTRYGYGDFLRTDRSYDFLFRVWPGSQRFLLGADPLLFAGYAREAVIGGSVGVEFIEPLSFRGRKTTGSGQRDLYLDTRLTHGIDDWRKYRYYYRLLGRLLYEPSSDPEQWRRYLVHEFGDAAASVESALSSASRVLPLVTTALGMSASNNFYWPEVPTNFPLAAAAGAGVYEFDTAEPKVWGGISPFDPELFDTTYQFVDGLLSETPSWRYSPMDVCAWLEGLASTAVAEIDEAEIRARDKAAPELRRVAIDVRIQARLAEFYAARLRAGVRYALYERTGDHVELAAAIGEYEKARTAMAAIVALAEGVYTTDIAFGDRPTERGSWKDRLKQLDADLAMLRQELDATAGAEAGEPRPVFVGDGERPVINHSPPESFSPGESIELQLKADVVSVTALIRRLNQGEQYRAIDLSEEGKGTFVGQIPSDIADGSYPVQYFLVIRPLSGRPGIYPGFDQTLTNRPYFVVRPASVQPG